MTSVIERIVAIIAPHACVVCSDAHNILCDACCLDSLYGSSFCLFCGQPTAVWRSCPSCLPKYDLQNAWAGAQYEGAIKKVLIGFKFERLKAAYKPLSSMLDASLPYLPPDWLVVPIPTASSRIRQRGYDQTFLIAKAFAKTRNLLFLNAVGRNLNSRQLGATRQKRQQQAKEAFYITKPLLVKGKKILLIDDVCTTGATLAAVAKILKNAGAEQISAAVCAWQPPEKSRHI